MKRRLWPSLQSRSLTNVLGKSPTITWRVAAVFCELEPVGRVAQTPIVRYPTNQTHLIRNQSFIVEPKNVSWTCCQFRKNMGSILPNARCIPHDTVLSVLNFFMPLDDSSYGECHRHSLCYVNVLSDSWVHRKSQHFSTWADAFTVILILDMTILTVLPQLMNVCRHWPHRDQHHWWVSWWYTR